MLDRAGRFDGSQAGVDALSWSGETATRIRYDLPVDAFSEPYFEPGLLAKLGAPDGADYLTAEVDDLSDEGYLRPPRVVIDPMPSDSRVPGETISVTVRRAESDYPVKLLSEIRLYHNAKLVPDGRLDKADGIARFRLPLAPGRNEFRALGVGYGGIEGPPSPGTQRGRLCGSFPSRPAHGRHRNQRLCPSSVEIVLRAQRRAGLGLRVARTRRQRLCRCPDRDTARRVGQ